MAWNRLRGNFLSGQVADNPLLVGATTLNSPGLATLPQIANGDYMAITIDPAGSGGSPEIAYVTAHTILATSATILRAQEGTGAREHAATTIWINSPTTVDYRGINNDRVWNRGTTAHALDDEFNDGVLDPAWTRIDVNAVSVVYTEGNDVLSINHAGGDAASTYAHGLVKSLGGLSFPITVEGAFRMFRKYATNYQMFGLTMTSGTTTAAAAINLRPYGNSAAAWSSMIGSVGRFTTIAGNEAAMIGTEQNWEWPGGILYQRLRWVTTNTFEAYWSADGVSWLKLPNSTMTATLTPTHFGVSMSTWSGANQCFGTVEYLRVTQV